jgi:KaiC/GvpD/RAD55 family RecA-like ATPase
MDSICAFYRDNPQRTFQEYNQVHDYSKRWHFIDLLVAERKKGETNEANEIKNDSNCLGVIHGFEASRENWQDTENAWTPTSTRSQNYNQQDQIWDQSGATRSAKNFRPNGSISSLARGLANESNYSKCLAAGGITKGQAMSSGAVALKDRPKRKDFLDCHVHRTHN